MMLSCVSQVKFKMLEESFCGVALEGVCQLEFVMKKEQATTGAHLAAAR